MYENIAEYNTINHTKKKMKYFNVLIGTIFLLTINMCDRGSHTCKSHDFIPRYDIISGTTRHSIGLGNGLERIRAQSGLRPLREPMMTKTYDVTGFTSLDYVIDCV